MNLGIVLISFLIWVVLATYVAKDSLHRDMNTTFWVIFTLIFGIIAILIYTISITPVYKNSSNKDTSQSSWKGGTSQSARKPSYWQHQIDHYDYTGRPVVEITDGEKNAKFVIDEGEIYSQSDVYKRRYGEAWIQDAIKHLENEF